jgi:hypothetical protein
MLVRTPAMVKVVPTTLSVMMAPLCISAAGVTIRVLTDAQEQKHSHRYNWEPGHASPSTLLLCVASQGHLRG